MKNVAAFQFASLVLGVVLAARASAADALLPPLIPGYGVVTPVENAGERPDPAMDYKVMPGVQVDLSAFTKVAGLQLRGYALLVD